MKARILSRFIRAVSLVILLTVAVPTEGAELPDSPNLQATPTPSDPTQSSHVPYDPFTRQETLPEYPRQPRAFGLQPQTKLAKPTGIDLDVTIISRAPMYNRYTVWYTADGKPYLRPGTEGDKRWPDHGEVVTFTAHVTNKGTIASGPFDFRWLIDDVQVHSGTHPSVSPGEEISETVQWAWAHTLDGERLLGQHTVQFEVDPDNVIAETYESNNRLNDRTDAISLVLALTPELYEALETPVGTQWPFSAEDWLQKQITAMNAAFARSVYSTAPNGVEERVRLDKILVTFTAPPTDWSEDGGFYMSGDDRFGNPYYDPSTDVSGALLHELTHQLGIIDIYNLDVALEIPQVLDRNGNPVQMELWASSLLPGLMGNAGIRPPVYSEHTALALNANKGYRRGYYGEYLYDMPVQSYLRVLDNQGNPAPGVTVRLYQRASSPNMLGSRHGVIDNTPEISVVTGGDGSAQLPNRAVDAPVSTHTGHTLSDNPLGVIDVVGRNDEFLVDLSQGTYQEYLWLDITQFNLVAWRGETTIEIASHVPPDSAPAAPAALSGTLEYGQVKLQWQPSPSSTVSGYNVYRTAGPADTWTRVVTETTGLNHSAAYDYAVRAAGYAITAVDDSGRESGFSDLFWALRLQHPAGIAVDANNQRIVLDPQNGYALFLQSPEGAYRDTLGSFDLHLENSQHIARDAAGQLIISHPGDWYSPRHSVRITDMDANLLFEFGELGSGPGEFQTPAGVAVWGSLCTFGGPYTADTHTSLLLHFDGDYTGAQCEPGTPNGTTFVGGQYEQGVLIDATDTLTYATESNIQRTPGTIEFWIRPQWNGGDGQSYTFFEVGDGWFNRLRIMKDGANNLRFMVWDSTTEYGVAYNVGHWKAGEWHHVAATWEGTTIALYVDGQQRDSRDTARTPDRLADSVYIGSSAWHGQQANAVIDEFRISDVPRIGNSDTCAYRILVADSGNHRIQAFDAERTLVSTYGGYGTGPGEFDNPQGLAAFGSGNVVVADSGNNRLQALSFDGTSFGFIRSITAGFDEPTGVATYGSSHIVVADTGNNRVKVLDTGGDLLATYESPNDDHTGLFSQPRGVAADRSARIVVADTGNRRVVTILDALPVWPPTQVAITGRSTGCTQIAYPFIATVSPATATQPITFVWQATGQSPVTHTGYVNDDTITCTWIVTGTHGITVTAINAASAVAGIHEIRIDPARRLYLPLVMRRYL